MLSLGRAFFSCILLCLISSAFADSSKELAEELVNDSQEKMRSYLSESKRLKMDTEKQVMQLLKKGGGCTASCLKLKEPTNPKNFKVEGEDTDKILIFISLSMPESSLKSLFSEAAQQNAILVMRGLRNNSIKDTAQVLKDLGISASIDPKLFEQYHITRVPAFVCLKGKEIVSLSGNVSLSYAIQKLKEAE